MLDALTIVDIRVVKPMRANVLRMPARAVRWDGISGSRWCSVGDQYRRSRKRKQRTMFAMPAHHSIFPMDFYAAD